MLAAVKQLSDARAMSDDEYARRRQEIEETCPTRRDDVHARRDQALADLFYRSGWTQDRLAEKEGKSQKWVDFQLRFGRFLNFSTTGTNPQKPPLNLTERAFRGFWEQTEKGADERARFRGVAELLAGKTRIGDSHSPKTDIASKLLAFADGKSWHTAKTLAGKIEAPEQEVTAVLENMRARGTYRTHCERRAFKTTHQYRMTRASGKKVDMEKLIADVEPILEKLEAEGRKSMAAMSPGTVAHLTHQLRKLLESLA